MKKVYVITGATSGIGLELVKYFSVGNTVFAGYRRDCCKQELSDISENVIPFYIDMEKPETIAEAGNFVSNNTEKINTIINVAGCVIAGITEKLDINELRKQFEVNTFSHLDFTQRLLNNFRPDKIINVSSMASFGIFPFIAPYCASKRALDILFNSLSLESQIPVISVKPGVIATPLWNKSVELNKNAINNCSGHEEEMKYLVQNAYNNGKNGLSVNEVVKVIAKADSAKNPKTSYTVGIDAFMTQMISKLPFDIQNSLIKFALKAKKLKGQKI